MKAKVTLDNIPKEKKDVWERMHEAYIDRVTKENFDMLRVILMMRTITAGFLAANDQLDLDPQESRRFIEGQMEIIMGESFDFMAKKGAVVDNIDPVTDSMLCEMARRGMYVQFKNVQGYQTVDEIAARLGDQFERSPEEHIIEYGLQSGGK